MDIKTIFDLETTGFERTSDVIQFSSIVIDPIDFEILKSCNYYFDSPNLTPNIEELTGLTKSFLVQNGVKDVISAKLDICAKLFRHDLIGHNIKDFDVHVIYNFLGRTLPNIGSVDDYWSDYRCLDTYKYWQKVSKQRKGKLEYLKEYFKISEDEILTLSYKHFPDAVSLKQHNAIYDVILTFLVYKNLMSM